MGAYAGLALANFNTGDTEEVIAIADKANWLSHANITLHRDDQAVGLLRRGLAAAPGSTSRAWLAAALALAGHNARRRRGAPQLGLQAKAGPSS